MFLQLRQTKFFWQIPDTDIILTAASPILELNEATVEGLTEAQRFMFDSALEQGSIQKFSSRPPERNDTVASQILNLTASEIQRKYISKYAMIKNIKGLTDLLEGEKKRPSPRESLVKLLNTTVERLLIDNPEERFYRQISEEILDVIEEPKVLKEEAPRKPKKRVPKTSEVG